MAQLYTVPSRVTDANGDPVSGAKLYFYTTGTLTGTAVYADADMLTSLGVVVTADSAGAFDPIYLDSGVTYRAVLKSSDGAVTYYDIDPVNVPDGVTETATQTLTNKTLNLASNTLTGTTAQFNTALSDGDFATLAGSETLSNKTVTGYTKSTGIAIGGFTALKIVTSGLTNYTSVITADSVVLNSASAGTYVAKAVNVSPAINASGANGLDTGTRAASTWYYVYVIWNGTTVAGLFSASATSPTLPSGYTHFALVGTVRTDGSGSKYLLQTRQLGRRLNYVVLASSNVAALPQLAGTASSGDPAVPTWTALSVANFVPPNASVIFIAIGGTGGISGQSAAAPSNAYGAYSDTTNQPPVSYTTTGSTQVLSVPGDFALESTSIYWASTGNFILNCRGCELNL